MLGRISPGVILTAIMALSLNERKYEKKTTMHNSLTKELVLSNRAKNCCRIYGKFLGTELKFVANATTYILS